MSLLRRFLLLSRPSSRSFHSPFLILRDSLFPLPTNSLLPSLPNVIYEKQDLHFAEPFTTECGTRTYVVSELDASSRYSNSVRCSPISTTADMLPIRANTIDNDNNIGGMDKDNDTVMDKAERKERITSVADTWRTRRA
ncbi:hypothetical protein JOM56_001343 [Amanita muscaria]